MTNNERKPTAMTYEEAVKARPPKRREKGWQRYIFTPEQVSEAIAALERDFPGTMEKIKEVLRGGFEKFEENEELRTKNEMAMLNACAKLRFVIDADDPYWTMSDIRSAIVAVARQELDA